jgi:WD40 repeat protein
LSHISSSYQQQHLILGLCVAAGNLFTRSNKNKFITYSTDLVEDWQSELQLEWQGQLTDLVTAIACSPDSGWVASSATGEVIWNAGMTDLVELQAAQGESIDSIAFSADSRWLAAGGQAGELSIWNCDDSHLPPQLVRRIRVGKWIEHLAWHPIESFLAISYGAQVEIWDIPTFTEISRWKCQGAAAAPRAAIFDLAWHPTGEYLAMSGAKGVRIWSDIDSKAPIERIEVDTASIAITWARNGRYLAAGNLDLTLTTIDWQHPADPWTLAGCPGKIRQMVWIEGGTTPCLAVASGIAVLLWHLTTDGTSWEGQYLEGHQDTVTTLAAHPNAPIVASGSADGYICLWSIRGEIQQIVTDGFSKFTSLAWHPRAKYLLTGSQTGSIGLWTIPA